MFRVWGLRVRVSGFREVSVFGVLSCKLGSAKAMRPAWRAPSSRRHQTDSGIARILNYRGLNIMI